MILYVYSMYVYARKKEKEIILQTLNIVEIHSNYRFERLS